jgi:release factor glutamine methyltransferase
MRHGGAMATSATASWAAGGWPDAREREALVAAGRLLREMRYEFTTTTPETHRRVLAREPRAARDMRDVLGWSRPFAPDALPPRLLDHLGRAGALSQEGELFRARVRASTLGDGLYFHSAYPTSSADAVFFGPDTYRFVAMLRAATAPTPPTASLGQAPRVRRLVDVGCGSGVGGLSLLDRADRVVLADVSPAALRLAEVNAELTGARDRVELIESDVLGQVTGDFDVVVSNPPYIVDDCGRTYRDGGGELGTALAVRIAGEARDRLPPGGHLLLYTGSPVVDGRDVFRHNVAQRLGAAHFDYREIDPDVFGEELERSAYAGVERIAAVALCLVVAASST